MKKYKVQKFIYSFIAVLLYSAIVSAQTTTTINEKLYNVTAKDLDGLGWADWERTYAVLYGSCTGGPASVTDRNNPATVTANQYGYYALYRSYNAMRSQGGNGGFNKEICEFRTKGHIEQDGTTTYDNPQLVTRGNWIRTWTVGIVDGSKITFYSSDYWFYLVKSTDINGLGIDTDEGHLTIEENNTRADYSVTGSISSGWQGTYIEIYRVDNQISLSSEVTKFCNVNIIPNLVSTKLRSGTVEIYHNNVLVGQKDGVFPNISVNVLDVQAKPGYEITSKTVSGTTFKIYVSDIKYTATFEPAGGTVTPSQLSYTVEDNITLPTLDDSSRKGYHFTGWKVKADAGSWKKDDVYSKGSLNIAKGKTGNVTFVAQWEDGESDLTVSISGLGETSDHVMFSVTGITGKGAGNSYTVALGTEKTSVTIKGLPIGEYKVSAASWSMSDNVTSNANASLSYEQHDITGDYEFKFNASAKSSPTEHAEDSKNNVFN